MLPVETENKMQLNLLNCECIMDYLSALALSLAQMKMNEISLK